MDLLTEGANIIANRLHNEVGRLAHDAALQPRAPGTHHLRPSLCAHLHLERAIHTHTHAYLLEEETIHSQTVLQYSTC